MGAAWMIRVAGRALAMLATGAVAVWASASHHSAHAADLVTLSPENFGEYAPQGKEADAVWGDYVLRNGQVTAAVSDPTLHYGRSGGRKGSYMLGRLIDLTTRETPNDLLGYFDPAFMLAVPSGVVPEADMQHRFTFAKDQHKLPGREPRSGKRVELVLPYPYPVKDVRYILEDGWPYLLVEANLENNRDKPFTFPANAIAGAISSGPVKMGASAHAEYKFDKNSQVGWIYDPWFGQAYVVACDPGVGNAVVPPTRTYRLDFLFGQGKGEAAVLQAGEKRQVRWRLFPGRNVFEAREKLDQVDGVKNRPIALTVLSAGEPVEMARVEAWREKALYGVGTTDEKGRLAMRLPQGAFELRIKPLEHAEAVVTLDAAQEGAVTQEYGPAAQLHVRAVDEGGRGLPAKIQIFGVGKTVTPVFFSPFGAERSGNILQPVSGDAVAKLAPGAYRLVITRGIEYDAVIREVTLKAGDKLDVEAKLKRSVSTPGWVSAEFANKSTVSTFWTLAPAAGRVLNLLAEGVEFAPATEALSVYSYKGVIKSLDAQKWLATEDGIHLPQPVRKSFGAQNAFPLTYVPGDQDGGIPQRPAHVFVVWWLRNIPFVFDQRERVVETGGNGKLIQVTPPGIWVNDGRLEGMSWLFDERKVFTESVLRDARLREVKGWDAVELQPLDAFLDLPEYDPADPKGQRDMDQWLAELDERESKKWPLAKDRNRDWFRMLNLGYRLTGVVNNYARNTTNGSGLWRNFVRTGEDDAAKLTAKNIIEGVRGGQVVMTNGPFAAVTATAGGASAGPGQDLAAHGKNVVLDVQVQCPDWIDIDRVQVIFNGHHVKALERRRGEAAQGKQAGGFVTTPGPVRFQERFALTLDADTHVVVIASGEGANLRPDAAESPKTMRYIAMTNPVYVDIDGDGFKPHSPTLDRVFAKFSGKDVPAQGKPLELTLLMQNLGDKATSDTVSLRVIPQDAATVKARPSSYTLGPGEAGQLTFEVTPTGKHQTFVVRAPRSSAGLGRRTAAVQLKLGKPLAGKPGAADIWLENQAPDMQESGADNDKPGNTPAED